MLTHRQSFFIYFILSIIAVYFVYSPAIHIPFYHHDVYKYSTGGFHQSCYSDQGYKHLFKLGRPFSAVLDCYNNKIANTLASMSYLRIFCALLIAVTASVFAMWMYAIGAGFLTAFCLSSAIFFLPAMQTAIIMGATTLIVPILLALAAYYFISQHSILIGIFGVGCLMAAFFTYPALAAFYLIPIFVLLLFQPLKDWKRTRITILRDIIIFAGCSAIYFIAIKYFQSGYLAGVPTNYQFNVNFHFLDRLLFIYKKLPQLWNIDFWVRQSILVNLIIIGGLIAAAVSSRHKSFNVLLQSTVAAIILFLLGCSVLLAVPSVDIPAGRVIFVAQAMLILLMYWSINKISDLFPQEKIKLITWFVGILFVAGAVFANFNVAKSALNDRLELNYVTFMLANYFAQPGVKLERVHIIAPNFVNFNGLTRGDDIFNDNSSRYAGDMANIVNTALLQMAERHSFSVHNCIFSNTEEELFFDKEVACIKTASRDDIVVTYSWPNKPVYVSPNTLVINMNNLGVLLNHK